MQEHAPSSNFRKNHRASLFLALALALCFPCAASAALAPDSGKTTAAKAPTKLLRFPALHGDMLVFCHGGDLWKVASGGGTATRLTAHPGMELFPRISPDGQWIAFTGQYDGDEQVYVIPATGGVPRQLTFYPATPVSSLSGSDNLVYGWTPDSKHILFRSLRDANSVTETGTLYTVPLSGGLPQKVGIPVAGAGDFSPDGTRIVYSPLFRDFRAWKRYEGGRVQYLVIFDLETKTTQRIDNDPRTEREPIWMGETIYFTSDRTGTLNLHAYDTRTREITRLTHETRWDVRWASGDKTTGKIVYELGGELHVLDTRAPSSPARKLHIHVPHDGIAMRPARRNVGAHMEEFAAAPGGKRLAIIARGDLFTAPVDKGFPRNLTNTSNAHERNPVWSHDGRTLAYISDKTGEDQIYLQDPKGSAPRRPLTSTFKSQLDNLGISPCGRNLTVTDSNAKLWLVPIQDNHGHKRAHPVEIAGSPNHGVPRGSFSPCGAHVAYILTTPEGLGQLHVYEIATRKTRTVTNPLHSIHDIAWDPAGNYLFLIARREFSPQHSTLEWNFAGALDEGIYALALRKNVPNPFAPQFDDDTTPKNTAAPDAAKNAGGGKTSPNPPKPKPKPKFPAPIKIDWENLENRVARIPIPFDNYSQLTAGDKFLCYVKSAPRHLGRPAPVPPRLMHYDLKERRESILLSNAGTGAYSLAPDASQLIYRASATSLNSLAPKPGAKITPLKTHNLLSNVNPAEEWAEIFSQVWRKYRDHFYVTNLHGYDWAALGRQYRTLLPHVAHRSDLNYVLSEMVAELNVSHAYIQGGDYPRPARPAYALPGCSLELDPEAGRYRIARIYQGDNAEPKYRSPLTEIGVDARAGDYVLEINGIPLAKDDNPYRHLRHHADPVTLTLNTTPATKGARKVTYVPITTENALRYHDYVQRTHAHVTQATHGRAGYLHIPDMGAAGAYEFLKWYYPQIRKEGLIIDVRNNGGGNISQWIITRLNQKLLGTRFGHPTNTPSAYPQYARHGHQVCLINETSSSDGDIFPHYFRVAGLGPLIGKRTWGGVVGISPRGPILDGGTVTIPLRGTNDTDGNWVIEGKGVEPDIEVSNDPAAQLAGHDQQLERAIEEILKRITTGPKKWPAPPEPPVKTK
jgi:tricorn protease